MEEREFHNLRLLYVEDEVETSEHMTRFLKRRFSKVITAKNGNEGFKKFLENHPDMIITDLLMPQSSGIEMIENIRNLGYTNPIIIISALQDINAIIKTVDLGINKYIIKPVDMEELDNCIRKFSNLILSSSKQIFNWSSEQKKEYESNIRHSLSNILKKHSGKGPNDVKVFIGSEQIEITCLNVLTPYESTLLQKGKNTALVEQSRLLFYNIIKNDIEDTISSEINVSIKVKNINANASSNTDIIHIISCT